MQDARDLDVAIVDHPIQWQVARAAAAPSQV
jgi:hypothetical protein